VTKRHHNAALTVAQCHRKDCSNSDNSCTYLGTLGSYRSQGSTTTLNIMKLSIITLSIMTFSIMTLSILTLSIMTLGIMTLGIMTLGIMTLVKLIIGINIGGCIKSVVMLSVAFSYIVILNDFMLSIISQIVVMLSVLAP